MNSEHPESTAPAEKTKPLRQKLSILLRDVPPDECCLILKNFEAAIMRGVVGALPLAGQHFGKVVVMEDGQKKRCTVQDEVVVVDDGWTRWLTDQRRESRYRVLALNGKVATTVERIKDGQDDFERLLDIRRKFLKGQQKGGES
ncbi:hypothetical protein [Deinococcus fonticola]|uniref:hypothetical protein n=1 Tax=Deinococcus fonticola TaxID=2528713 RepID=UPI00107578B9|nr:hypothetical protein [Deinococcus fonticola]